jgi:hypothetical protein
MLSTELITEIKLDKSGFRVLDLSERGRNHLEQQISRGLEEFQMRLICLFVAVSFALLSFPSLAQQSPGTTGDTIGHPPPLPGPPAESAPPIKADSAPSPQQVTEPAPKGYLGAYAPPGTPATPYSTGPLPTQSVGPGLNVAGPDGATKSIKAIPCSAVARETDGFTTCVGIPDAGSERKRH